MSDLRQALPPAPPASGRGEVRFAGYAAVFGHPDNGGDVILPGAFAASLERGLSVPLLWQHQPGRVIGRIEHLSEDQRGLRVIAALDGAGDGAKAGSLLTQGRVGGLSFGYRVRGSERKDGVRELQELELVEVSLVAKPMQKLARVHAVENGVVAVNKKG